MNLGTAPAQPGSKKLPGQIAPEKYTRERVLSVHRWAPHLFSFRTTRPAAFRFKPGQWARLGVYRDDEHPGLAGLTPDSIRGDDPLHCGPRFVWRAYSVVSASYDEYLEFYSIVVPDGDFTSHLSGIEVGDELLVEKASYGFLTLDRFQGGRDLWMLASGTGLAPFISVLQEPETWERFARLVLVHSVREAGELAYRDTLGALSQHPVVGEHLQADPARLVVVPIVTRAPLGAASPATLNCRIPVAIESGQLEQAAGVALTHEHSRIMICGNPDMVDDVRDALILRGFGVSRSSKPGQIAVENYW